MWNLDNGANSCKRMSENVHLIEYYIRLYLYMTALKNSGGCFKRIYYKTQMHSRAAQSEIEEHLMNCRT